ncbi:hypothetical protein CTEN210_01134 [Chaetoceros tenuissimus]|uniref:Uncharacterized protein n=1 Tax=Chaetoceros tenuissimus TaxID=426638 RepID=A0AAD3GZD5_9STRA|nr:hypothetical protein CTEN210_01134 [Chaetoceros tenuissimus]
MVLIQFLVQQNNLAGKDSSCHCEGEEQELHDSKQTRQRSTSLSSIVSTSSKRGTSEGASSFSSEVEDSIEARLSHAINIAQQENCRPFDPVTSSPYSTTIPVIDFSSSFSEKLPARRICCSLLTCSKNKNKRNTFFEEGTSAFTSHITLSLLDENVSHKDSGCTIASSASSIHETYSFQMITATLLFNMGILKIRDYDYTAAKTYFQQALEVLVEVKLHVLNSITASGTSTAHIKKKVLDTHTLLTSITLLNLGHVSWYLSAPDDSIRSYQQCLESLKQGIESSGEVEDNEVRIYRRYIKAACLNCIGMAFMYERVLPCQAESDTHNLLPQAEICIKYLEASLAIYEQDCKSNAVIRPDDDCMMTFRANMATTLNNLGRVYYIINDFSQALHYQGACLRERSACLPSAHLDLSVTHFNVAQSLATLNENEEALEHYHVFLSDATPILGFDHAIIIGAVITVIDLYIDMEDYDGAEALLREYLSSSSAFVSTESLQAKLTLLNSLSAVLNYQNKLQDTLETLTQARNIILALPQDESTARSYITNCCNIAVILSKNQKIEKAVIMFHKALAKIETFDNQVQFSKLLIEIHMNMASIYESIGNYSICIMNLEKVVAIAKTFYGPLDSHVSTYLNQLGLMYYREEEYETALSAFIECLHIRTHCKKNNKRQIIAVMYNVATVYKAMGTTEEALRIYHKVLTYERQTLKEQEGRRSQQPKDLIHTLRHIFQIYKEQGLPQDGLNYLLEAVDLCRQYKDKIDIGLGRGTFFLMGEYLSFTHEVTDGFKYYCEGCELFGGVDDDTLYAAGENGLRIILAQLCTNEKIFPIHAAAA